MHNIISLYFTAAYQSIGSTAEVCRLWIHFEPVLSFRYKANRILLPKYLMEDLSFLLTAINMIFLFFYPSALKLNSQEICETK